ncbi:IPExxxVDY family protein [Nonlabens ulvanivorans]|uniref:IPExxxVDY family protein n=1 Tax=Nonlabens ulvanivorans TaxID=906888 RepID=UPI002942FE84|nr:IPExxxVDY family protein [Nonlabens ulvanivorans]WOI22582.1 IPExxxVDY family protein [Nonlabens ulvanivorans]
MATYKLDGWDCDDEPYTLVGIHSTIEPYRMAYMVNKYLGLSFKRTDVDQDVTMPNFTVRYPVYKYDDVINYNTYYLTPNKFWANLNTVTSSGGLFESQEQTEVKTVLIKEYARVDFIIKVEKDPEFFPLKKLINELTKIPHVISAYQLDEHVIKQKDYLIFE